MAKVNFICPVCGGTVLREVAYDPIVTSDVLRIWSDDMDTTLVDIDYGCDFRFTCKDCDFVISDDVGYIVRGNELYNWLKSNGMLEVSDEPVR